MEYDEFGGVALDEPDEFGGIPISGESEIERPKPTKTQRELDDESDRVLGEMINQDYAQNIQGLSESLAEPMVKPDVIGFGIEHLPNLYTASQLPFMPESVKKFARGAKEALVEGVSGMTSPESIAMTPAFAVPYVGQGLALGLGSKALGTGLGTATAAIEQGDVQGAGRGFGEAVLGASMIAPAARSLRPEPPAAITEAIRKGQEVGLSKSVEALKKTEEAPAVEVVKTDAPVESSVNLADLPIGEQIAVMSPDQFMSWSKEQKGGITQTAYEYGKTLKTPEEISRLKELESAAEKAGADALANGDIEAALPLVAKKQFFTEALESAVGVAENKVNLTAEQVAKAKEAGKPPVPVEPAAELLPPEGQKMRKSAERATTSEQIPPPVQETIKTAPESFYDPQSMKRVEEVVSTMPDNELGAVPKESDLYTAAKLEQADRLFKAGNNEAGYQVFVELEKEGTRMGQLINQFKLLTSSRPEQVANIVNQKLTKAGKDPLKPQQAETITSAARDSKAFDQELGKATDAWVKNPTPENAKAAELALDKANEGALKLQREVAKFEPRSLPQLLKSILQGSVLAPISHPANVFGNMSFNPFRALERTGTTGLDVLDTYLTGSPRQTTVQPIRGTIEMVKGFGRGAKQIPAILAKGTGDVVQGETRAGMHPLRAWADQFAKNPERPTEGGKLPFSERLNMAIEGTFGVPAEAMLRLLGAGDAPFKEGARARLIATELSLKGVPKEQWSFAQKFPELFLDKAQMEKLRTDSAAAVFQQPSATLNKMTQWVKEKGDWFDFALATVAPFKQTPWNIIKEFMSYNPLIAAAQTARFAKKGDRLAAKRSASKFVIGSTMTAGAAWLYMKGLLAPSMDEKDEAQKARLLAGEVLPPNHVNISGLKRALSGGDPAFKPGDETVDIMRGGGLAGAIMYMTSNIGRDFERKPEVLPSEFWWSLIKSSSLEQARFGLNQSFLQGVEGFLTAVKDGETDNWAQKWANTVSSIALPNTLAALSRATREYKPDLKADTAAGQLGNIVKNKLGFAGLDDYLPLKRDLWGQPMKETPKKYFPDTPMADPKLDKVVQKRNDMERALIYHFFDISKNRQVTDDPVALELYRLWRKTADTKVIPSLPGKNLTIQKQNFILTPEQQSRYAELVGTERRRIMDAIVINPNFHELSDENKIRLLDRVYRDGMESGKVKFWEEYKDVLTPKKERAGFSP